MFEVDEVESARVLDPSAEDQVKLAHARLASGFAALRQPCVAGRIERRAGRSLAASVRPSSRLRIVSSPFSRLSPELVEALRAGVLRGLEGGARAVLHPARGRADEAGFGFGARQQRGDQRAGREPAGKRDERGFAERVGGASRALS